MNKKRVFVYVRVSTQEQAREGYSIGEQIERLTNYCKAMGWIIVKVYTDAGHSGANQDRPALQEMIADIKAGKADSVVVYKLDRLSRSQRDTLELIEDVLLANNVDFVSMNENFDTATPFGRAIIGILAVFAQLEREQIRERMTMGKDARAKEGKWSGGSNVPFGYDYIDGELKINEFEAMQLRELFKLFTEGMPPFRIENLFEEKGYKKFHNKSMKYALRNKIYIGYLKHRDTWNKGIHDPIIDVDTFEKANKILDERKEKFEESGHKAGSKALSTYLGGLVYCEHCGARFGKQQTGSAKSKIYINYCCYSRSKKVKAMIKDPSCQNKMYRMHELDNHVFNAIRKLSLEPETIQEMKENKIKKSNSRDQVAVIEAEIKSLMEQKSRFMDLYGIGRFSIDELDEKVMPLEDRKNKLQREIEKLTANDAKLDEEDALLLINSFGDILERNIFDEIRTTLESLIDRIVIDNETVDIHWTFI